mmetsp:Transcript_14327/g.34928  ORF Transcript_14327/g.34928 Transcript_14327/m.34928 type:complete len:209 (-) Transcript_14327:22-648(-)
MFSTDPSTSGLWIERNGEFERVPTTNVGDMVLIAGDKFLHRSCRVEKDNERMVIVFFFEYSNPKDAKCAAEEVTRRASEKESHLTVVGSQEKKRKISKGSEALPEAKTLKDIRNPTATQVVNSPITKKDRVSAEVSSAMTSDGASSASSTSRRRERKRREGYVLEDYDKIEDTTTLNVRSERDRARAKRRRRRLLRKTGKKENEINCT